MQRVVSGARVLGTGALVAGLAVEFFVYDGECDCLMISRQEGLRLGLSFLPSDFFFCFITYCCYTLLPFCNTARPILRYRQEAL
jgi:hypothetical protein